MNHGSKEIHQILLESYEKLWNYLRGSAIASGILQSQITSLASPANLETAGWQPSRKHRQNAPILGAILLRSLRIHALTKFIKLYPNGRAEIVGKGVERMPH